MLGLFLADHWPIKSGNQLKANQYPLQFFSSFLFKSISQNLPQ